MSRATATARPVHPRDAASLVVLRGRGDKAEVLMGLRGAGHKFIPNRYVFPGGRLDPADRAQPALREPDPAMVERLLPLWPAAKTRALAAAALRETFEETGLAFGRVDERGMQADLSALGYLARAITPSDSPIRFHARFFLADAERAEGRLAGSGELQDLRFVAIAEALTWPIVDVTEFVLRDLQRRLAGQVPPGLPFFGYRNGRPSIRYE
ncbi:MAG: NUDIX hydrolase [Alphaproteobacteria bacterium]|nr:NUDIX hydrolase [Alphaproteobacteria bacterium]